MYFAMRLQLGSVTYQGLHPGRSANSGLHKSSLEIRRACRGMPSAPSPETRHAGETAVESVVLFDSSWTSKAVSSSSGMSHELGIRSIMEGYWVFLS